MVEIHLMQLVVVVIENNNMESRCINLKISQNFSLFFFSTSSSCCCLVKFCFVDIYLIAQDFLLFKLEWHENNGVWSGILFYVTGRRGKSKQFSIF